MKTIILNIPGMKSPHCQMAVKYTVEKLEGAPLISTQAGQAAIDFDPTQVSESTIVEAIEKAGYQVADRKNFLTNNPILKLWKH